MIVDINKMKIQNDVTLLQVGLTASSFEAKNVSHFATIELIVSYDDK